MNFLLWCLMWVVGNAVAQENDVNSNTVAPESAPPVDPDALQEWWKAAGKLRLGDTAYRVTDSVQFKDGVCDVKLNKGMLIPVYTGTAPVSERVVGVVFVGDGRVLVDCPELRKAMLESGYAHPFSIGGPAPEADLQAMRIGMENKAGIWGKGVPSVLITSLHSQDEKPDKEVYNRVCDLQTGECAERVHTETYETCQTVCIENGCMIYVPYKERYGDNRAECLR